MRKVILLLCIICVVSCKKDNTPPELSLKSGSGYTSSDITVSAGSQFTVRMIANKGADDLSMAYIEVAFDGANTTRLVSRIYIGTQNASHYEKDITATTRPQPGTERWVFNINDANGRITKQEIKVTVQ